MLQKSIVFFFLFSICSAANAQFDTLLTTTGELFIGTAKSLFESRLTFSSKSGREDFVIDWKNVSQLNTNHLLRVVSKTKEVHEGVLKDDQPGDPYLYFHVDREIWKIAYDDILAMRKIENSFKDKLDLRINAGYTFTKGTNTTQLSVRSAVGYNTEKWSFDADYNEFLTIIDTLQNNRLDASASSRFLIDNSWFASSSANWFSSDEQQLNLRTTILVGGGRYLIYNQQSNLRLGLGVAWNNERFSTEVPVVRESYETYLSGRYRLFDNKYLNIQTNFIGFASLTEDDRYRATFNLDLGWDLGENFDLIWGYGLNFDSNPPNNAQQTDYVISLTVGWSL